MKTLRILAVVSLAVTITACCSCRRSGNTIPLVGTEWKLSQLGNEVIDSENFRMTLGEDGRITGIGDCNRFTGPFTRRAGSNRVSGGLAVGDGLVSTRMMCPGQARETEFLKMLREIDSYSIDGQRLMLIRGGDVLAIFEPAPVTADPAPVTAD